MLHRVFIMQKRPQYRDLLYCMAGDKDYVGHPALHPSGQCRIRYPVRDRLLRFSTSLATVLTLELLVIKKAPVWGLFYMYGWGTRIRTLVGGVRVRSPAARRSPNSLVKRCQADLPEQTLTF